jgi:O-antigen/teichoic acid export membrane protein
VAPYEVANRAIVALRSIPASGAETLLPIAAAHRARSAEAWDWYLSMTRGAAYAACVFLIAPAAIAAPFLYAWTGEMGYVGRWVFVALSVGSIASVLSLPAVALAQAEGQPYFQTRAALTSIIVNVPLSLLLVTRWDLVGAAIGTSIAMLCSAWQLLHAVHRHFDRPLRPTLAVLARFWPAVLVCLLWGAITYLAFERWFAGVDWATRFSREMRLGPGIAALVAYVACVASIAAVEFYRGAFSGTRRARLAGAKKWFASGALRWRQGHPPSE